MKTIIRHGEVILKEIDSLPKELTLETETNKYIVAHSETGHHHILETKQKYKIFTTFDGNKFIELTEDGNLWHQKTGNDVHTPHIVKPGIYQIVIKKEFDYFQSAIRNVRDQYKIYDYKI